METSIKGGSISVFRNGKLIDFHIGDRSVSGAEDLLPKMSKLLDDNEISKSDVETIAVSNGPGSFTGIRIGIATALAIGKSLNCKCYGVDLLKALALKGMLETPTENIITAVSHGRNKICWFSFNKENLRSDNVENNYFVSDLEVLWKYIVGKADKNSAIYTDADIYKLLSEKPENIKIMNAGENLSAIVGGAVLDGEFKLEKPKPLYSNESNFIS